MSRNSAAEPGNVVELDARNLMCPLPVIRTQDRVKTMRPGERLRVICTDPGALNEAQRLVLKTFGHVEE